MDESVPLVSHHETGLLTQPSSQREGRFIGSSSGVYFFNTVKRAFEISAGRQRQSSLPDAEECVGGEDDLESSTRGNHEHAQPIELHFSRYTPLVSLDALPQLPPYEDAKVLAIEYFRIWHPILPFLSGPSFLDQLEAFYDVSQTTRKGSTDTLERDRLCRVIIFQCVFAMGRALRAHARNTAEQSAQVSTSDLLAIVAPMADRHDTLTIQTILAAEVYCISVMALRTASSLGGLLSRLLFHAGMHRCPNRYPLDENDRVLRKRILWSTFVLDKYLCQALGVPLALSDSDIDVCIPGRYEKHSDLTRCRMESGEATTASLNKTGGRIQTNSVPAKSSEEASIDRQQVIAHLVEYCLLLSRALELFHKSIHIRRIEPQAALFLRSDVDKWYNNLPQLESDATDDKASTDGTFSRFLPFFHVLYEQLLITINRPSLSLPQTSAEFHHALQITIGSAKRTISNLERHVQLFWPGFVASVWMSGLILAFASQIGLYDASQGSREIERCLSLLKRMSERWPSARRCHDALSTLLNDLQQPPHKRLTSDLDCETMQTSAESGRPLKHARLSRNIVAPSVADVNDGAMLSESGFTDLAVPHPGATASMTGPLPSSAQAQWSLDDFFQDLAWDNLVDLSDPSQDLSCQYF